MERDGEGERRERMKIGSGIRNCRGKEMKKGKRQIQRKKIEKEKKQRKRKKSKEKEKKQRKRKKAKKKKKG